MEDCPDANTGAAATAAARLPDELILEILSLLPARSVDRFKCVSKRWRDLIADPLNKKRLAQTIEGFFCGDGARAHGRFISLPGRPASLADPSFSFLTKQPELEKIKLLDSCNGLVLFERRSDPATAPPSYVVCNPATEQWVVVPSCGVTSQNPNEIHLIFDPVATPHFHLLSTWHKRYPGVGFDVRGYSSETRGWSDCVSDQLVNVGRGITRSGRIAFVNGMLYFIMWKGILQIVAMFMEGKPRFIPLPDGNTPLTLFVAHQSQGPLHCMTSTHPGSACPMTERGLSIWVLEDYDAGHWVLKHSVSFSELFEKISRFSFSVVSVLSECDGVFFIRYCDLKGDRQRKLLSCDMYSMEVHELHNFGHAYCSLIPYVPYFLESSVLANRH